MTRIDTLFGVSTDAEAQEAGRAIPGADAKATAANGNSENTKASN